MDNVNDTKYLDWILMRNLGEEAVNYYKQEHSIEAYLERRDIKELQAILLAYCEGYADINAEMALKICEAVYNKDLRKVDPRKEFIRLCLMYTQ